ncbi:RHS repeat-associated core domain-containing protein [Sphaerisporangium sp. B11E5]|uniref:RHS repeat-associated core domain-containing protein n=1 Tax=Sphaerisporangium sp. B11E5 TaxID=3153563 RepID=UPI00325E373C
MRSSPVPPRRTRHLWTALVAGLLAALIHVPAMAVPAAASVTSPGNLDGLAAATPTAPAAVGMPGGAGQASTRGDYTFTYPIEVPPGRKKMQPALSLAYSSAGDVHGGIAAGWSLPIPAITVDPQPGAVHPVEPGGDGPAIPRDFVAPDGSPLVADATLPKRTGGIAFRALGDGRFTRYEYLGQVSGSAYWWEAFTQDGDVVRFGRKDQSPYSYAPLVEQLDGDGHTLKYVWRVVGRNSDTTPAAGLPREFLLDRIDYLSPGATVPYARVFFYYDAPVFCGNDTTMPPVGSRLDYRQGFGRLTGTRKLTRISTAATRNGALSAIRRYDLGYTAATEQCANNQAGPFRELASVSQTGFAPGGGTTVLPPTTFTYGKAATYTQDAHYETPTTLANLRVPESVHTLQNGGSHDGDGDLRVDRDHFHPDIPFVRCDVAFCDVPGNAGSTRLPSSQGGYTTSRDASQMAWRMAQTQATGESVSTLYLDVNADGRPDMLRLTASPRLVASPPVTGNCQVQVWVNKGDPGFVMDSTVFSGFSLRDAMADIPVASLPGSAGTGELLCSLSRSFSAVPGGWRGVVDYNGPEGSARMGDGTEPCSDYWEANAAWGSMHQVMHGFFDVDGDRDPDLVSQPVTPRDCPYDSTQDVPWNLDDPDPTWVTHAQHSIPGGIPDPELNPCQCRPVIDTVRQSYWYVYKNTGTGFSTTPTRVRVPSSATLPDTTAPERFWANGRSPIVPQQQVAAGYKVVVTDSPHTPEIDGAAVQSLVSDLTGDGYLDYVTPSNVNGTVRVHRGTGSGGFHNSYTHNGEDLRLPVHAGVESGDGELGYLKKGVTLDVNGDTLPDRVEVLDNGTEVRFNKGYGFGTAADGGQVMFSDGAPQTTKMNSTYTETYDDDWRNYPTHSERHHRTRTADLDGDGHLDVLYYTPDGQSKLYLGGGTQWNTVADADASVAPMLAGRMITGEEAIGQSPDRSDYRQRLTHQAVDLNGDGLLDLLQDPDGDGIPTVRLAKQIIDTSAPHNAPARLLRTVANGFGATDTVTYTRDSAAGKWLASEVKTTPGQSEPAITMRMAYRGPAYVAGPYGQHVFRGYTEVATLTVGNPGSTGDDLTTLSQYAYDLQPGGTLTRTVTVRGNAAFTSGLDPATTPGVATVTEHTYHVHQLDLLVPGMRTDYPSRVVLPKQTTRRTCTGAGGQTLNACVASAPFAVEETFWTAEQAGGEFVLLVPEKTETRFTDADGVPEIRRTEMDHSLAWDADTYVIALVQRDVSGVTGGTPVPLSTTVYDYYDADLRRVETITSTDETDAGAPARTVRYAYHSSGTATGQVKRTWAPQQVSRYGVDSDNDPGYTDYAYDTQGVHVTTTTFHSGSTIGADAEMPFDHVVTQKVDGGTGAVTESAGPDFVCPDGTDAGSDPEPPSATCTPTTAGVLRQRTVTSIDGLGRALEVTAYPAGPGAGVVVARASYDDMAAYNTPGTPVSSVTETPAGDGELTHAKAELDGLGRTVKTTVQQDPQADKVVTYDYDAVGRMAAVHSPRPDGQPGTVGMAVTYDALGRTVRLDETGSGTRQFTHTSYNGLTTSVTEVVQDGSPESVTRSTVDPLGQVVLVEEKTAETGGPGGGGTYATTHYRYDTAGNTRRVQDPDDAVTVMTHDGFGQRHEITTGGTGAGRTWTYDYDRNGNLVKVTEPVPAGGTAADYARTMTYDDLDRVLTETPAPRDLEADDPGTPADDLANLDALKIGVKRYVYDRPHPSLCASSTALPIALFQIGRLTCTDSAIAKDRTRYDGHGRPITTWQRLDAMDGLGLAVHDLQTSVTYHSTGTVESTQVQAFAALGGSPTYDGPVLFTDYDRDATPAVTYTTLGGKNMTIANTRNAAGLLTQRDVNTGATSGFARPVMNWGHDRYGRVTGMTAALGSTLRYVATYEYNEAGEIWRTDEVHGDGSEPPVTSFYTYDLRDQLLTANSGDSSGMFYNGEFSYTPGGRLASANITTAGAFRATARNVTYEYQDPATGDPQRLDALRKPDTTDLATYVYDEAGNTTSRTLPDGTQATQVWDGPNLRLITKPGGGSETVFYDGHRRVAAVHRDAAGTVTGATRWYGAVEVQYAPGANNGYRTYLTLAGQSIGRIDGDSMTGTLEHYLTSPQGHHVLALDAAGTGTTSGATTRRAAAYTPFGDELIAKTATTTPPPAGRYSRQINDKDHDSFAGLNYYGHRWADLHAMQWTSADPLFRFTPDLDKANPRTSNLYTFTLNNPVSNVDPNGLCIFGVRCFWDVTAKNARRDANGSAGDVHYAMKNAPSPHEAGSFLLRETAMSATMAGMGVRTLRAVGIFLLAGQVEDDQGYTASTIDPESTGLGFELLLESLPGPNLHADDAADAGGRAGRGGGGDGDGPTGATSDTQGGPKPGHGGYGSAEDDIFNDLSGKLRSARPEDREKILLDKLSEVSGAENLRSRRFDDGSVVIADDATGALWQITPDHEVMVMNSQGNTPLTPGLDGPWLPDTW